MKAPQQPTESREQRVVLLTANSEQGKTLHAAMTAAGLPVAGCTDMDELCSEISRGAWAAVVAEDALTHDGRAKLESALREQPAWSDFPLIILAGDRASNAASRPALQQMDVNGNAALLEYPNSPRSLVSMVKVALRSRQRQYELRDHLAEHERTESQLRVTASSLGERAHERAQTLRLLRDVATAANSAESVEEALSFALAQVCRHTGWAFGHAFLPATDEPDCLAPVNASYERAPGRFRAFRAATLTLRIPRGIGLVGRVYASGQSEWTRRIDRELEAMRAQLGEDLGVATAAAFPIMIGMEVVGVLEFFSEEVADPDIELLDAMTSIGTQLGRVIERDRMDRAVRDSYRLIEKIGDTSPTMIRIFDEVEGRYVHVNERMAKFFGMSAQEAMRTGFERMPAAVHPDDQERFRQAKARVGRPGRKLPVTWQGRIRNAAGKWRWVRTWSSVFTRNEEGAPAQILSISIDVTDEVEAEERLRQTERLMSIGTLSAGIAHEINNPLASVVMTAQLLRKKANDPETDQMLENLIQDAKRCGRIVRSVQKFARQEPSDRVLLDLNAVVRAAEELSRIELRRAGINLRLELEKDLPPVTGDATELEQVVVNLITNGAHASQRGQEVVVRTLVTNGFVRVCVQDEGHGISPDVKRRIFDPFFTTRGREGGTGLGLSIAHGIVEDHGGTIEIDSALGSGTTVTITLPAEKMAPGNSDDSS
jgi:PAS domain S-box-containing protein